MSKKLVLLVDDEEIIVRTMKDDLEFEGYRVDVALDGQEGLSLFAVHRHNLVIVDLIMKEMGGIELAQKIKEIDPQTKVVVLTGYGTRQSAIDALRLGVSDFLIKPYNRKDLSQKVAKVLGDQEEVVLRSKLNVIERKLNEWGLTTREIEISKLMFAGMTKDEIASKLFISKMTVVTHIKNIYKKLNVNNLSKFIAKLTQLP